MPATLKINADNNSGKAFAEVRADAAQTGRAVDEFGNSMSDASSEADHLRQANDGLQDELESLQRELQGVQDELDDTRDQLRKTADESKKLGDAGGKSAKGWGLQITEVNSGLEILKKGAELASAFISAAAENGSPAFKSLQGAIGDVHKELLDLANDPQVEEFAQSLADGIKEDAIPAMRSFAQGFVDLQGYIADTALATQEYFGIIDKGTREEMRLGQEVAAQRRAEEKELQKQQVVLDGLADITKRLADERHNAALAAIDGEGSILALLEDEKEELKELAKTGELTDKQREERLKTIEILERRLIEVREQAATEEIRRQTEVADARAKTELELKEQIKAAQEEVNQKIKEARSLRDDAARQEIEELKKLIGEARGEKQSLLDQARGGISDREAQGALRNQRIDDARQKVLEEGRAAGRVDQNGQAIGNTPQERSANQAALNRQLRQAEAEAAKQFQRDLVKGRVSAGDLQGARDNILLDRAQKNLDPNNTGMNKEVLQALREQVQLGREQLDQQRNSDSLMKDLQGALSGGGRGGGNKSAAAAEKGATATGNLAGKTAELADVSTKAIEAAAQKAMDAEQAAQTAIDRMNSLTTALGAGMAATRAQRGGYGQ